MKRSRIFLSALHMLVAGLVASCQMSLQPVPPTSTPTAAPTFTPTMTPTSTATPSPTPLPPGVLTSRSCSNLKELGRIGKGRVNQMFYTPDGSSLVVASDGGLSFFDAVDMKKNWDTSTDESLLEAGVEASRDRIFALDSGDTMQIFDLEDGVVLGSVSQNDGFMGTTLAQDAKQISAAGFDSIVYVYDTINFQLQKQIKGPAASSDSLFADMFYIDLKHSPNGKYLAIATLRSEILTYRVSDGALVRKIDPLSPDYDNRIFPTEIVFSLNENTIAAEYENGQTLVTRASGNAPVKMIEGTQPSLSADGKTLALKTEKGIDLFDTATGQSIAVLPGTGNALGSAFSPTQPILAVASPGSLEFWDLENDTLRRSLNTTFSDFEYVAVSPDGEMLAAAFPGGIELYQTQIWDRTVLAETQPVNFLKFTEDPTRLIASGPDTISIWDLSQQKQADQIQVPEKIISMDVSGDGKKAVVVTGDQAIKLFDLATGKNETLGEPSKKFKKVLFSGSDMDILALGEDKNIYLSTPDQPAFANFIASKQALDMMLSPDGTTLFTSDESPGENALYRVYELPSGKKGTTLSSSNIIAISPINNLLALPGNTDTPWKLRDIHAQSSCDAKKISVEAQQILFSPDGEKLFVLGKNGMLYIYGVEE